MKKGIDNKFEIHKIVDVDNKNTGVRTIHDNGVLVYKSKTTIKDKEDSKFTIINTYDENGNPESTEHLQDALTIYKYSEKENKVEYRGIYDDCLLRHEYTTTRIFEDLKDAEEPIYADHKYQYMTDDNGNTTSEVSQIDITTNYKGKDYHYEISYIFDEEDGNKSTEVIRDIIKNEIISSMYNTYKDGILSENFYVKNGLTVLTKYEYNGNLCTRSETVTDLVNKKTTKSYIVEDLNSREDISRERYNVDPKGNNILSEKMFIKYKVTEEDGINTILSNATILNNIDDNDNELLDTINLNSSKYSMRIDDIHISYVEKSLLESINRVISKKDDKDLLIRGNNFDIDRYIKDNEIIDRLTTYQEIDNVITKTTLTIKMNI